MSNKTVNLILAVILFSLLPHGRAVGQQKIERFLRKVDSNQNGRVDTSEMTPQIRRYLKSKGFDTNGSVKIRSVVRTTEKSNRNAQAKGTAPAKADSRVPGFGGDDSDATKSGVVSFGVVDAPKHSESTKKQAANLLLKYDGNRNNMLDEDEIRGIPWGSPSPSQNDKNRDGRLSLTEIEGRYHAREMAKKKRRNDSNRQNVAKARQNPRTNNRSTQQTFSATASPQRNSLSKSQSSSVALQKQREKIIKYADGYFMKHDGNKNGMLDKDELNKMRRPPTNADTNSDGRVSKNEFVASQMPNSSALKSNANSPSKSSNRSGRRDDRTSLSTSKAAGGSSRSNVFGGQDKNNDNILQMHEYADRWTQATLDAFNKKDSNGDGLITPREWLQR